MRWPCILAGLFLLMACATRPPVTPVTVTDTVGPYEVTITAAPDPERRRTVNFTIEVRGGPDEDAAFACPGTRWDYGDGTGLVGDPVTAFGRPCPSDKAPVPRRITASHSYEKAGTYDVAYSHGALRARVKVEVQ